MQCLDASVGRSFDGGEQRVVARIECHSERRVDDVSANVRSEIDFHHIISQQHLLVTCTSAFDWLTYDMAIVEQIERNAYCALYAYVISEWR